MGSESKFFRGEPEGLIGLQEQSSVDRAPPWLAEQICPQKEALLHHFPHLTVAPVVPSSQLLARTWIQISSGILWLIIYDFLLDLSQRFILNYFYNIKGLFLCLSNLPEETIRVTWIWKSCLADMACCCEKFSSFHQVLSEDETSSPAK